MRNDIIDAKEMREHTVDIICGRIRSRIFAAREQGDLEYGIATKVLGARELLPDVEAFFKQRGYGISYRRIFWTDFLVISW